MQLLKACPGRALALGTAAGLKRNRKYLTEFEFDKIISHSYSDCPPSSRPVVQSCSIPGLVHSHLKRPPVVTGCLPQFMHYKLPSRMFLSVGTDQRWFNGIIFPETSFRSLLMFGFFGRQHPFYHQRKSYKTAHTDKPFLPPSSFCYLLEPTTTGTGFTWSPDLFLQVERGNNRLVCSLLIFCVKDHLLQWSLNDLVKRDPLCPPLPAFAFH